MDAKVYAGAHCGNLTHIVLNNASHDSVGGQPTVGGDIDFPAIAAACGYEVHHNSDFSATLRLCVSALKKAKPRFVEIKVAKGARKDLGRPKEPPQVNKKLFMETLGAE